MFIFHPIRHAACFFHLGQSIHRKVSKKYQRLYRENEEFRVSCRNKTNNHVISSSDLGWICMRSSLIICASATSNNLFFPGRRPVPTRNRFSAGSWSCRGHAVYQRRPHANSPRVGRAGDLVPQVLCAEWRSRRPLSAEALGLPGPKSRQVRLNAFTTSKSIELENLGYSGFKAVLSFKTWPSGNF